MTDRHSELYAITLKFLDAFNRNHLDDVMSFFTDDVVYEELHGKINDGKEAVRQAFVPQFEGKFGKMKFIEDDTFIDCDAGKVMSSWTVHLEKDGGPMTMEGLDLLDFEGDKIARKRSFVKQKDPL
jgi:ketosteroid isomerase-like protein